MFIRAFMSSCLDYSDCLFMCLSKTLLDLLQVVQNAAAKLLTKPSRWSSLAPYPVQNLIQGPCDHI